MRAHYLQHADFERLGSIRPWLESRGYRITCTRLHLDEALPPLGDIDLLVIMGGVMSVNDEQEHAWLVAEKAFIRSAIDHGLAVLGVCLGAQLIANVMGSRVWPNSMREIGWFPIQAIDHGREDVFSFPEQIKVLHWHGETFELPPDAIHLASSGACHHQAFQLGDRIIGLQCHLESTPSQVKAFVEATPVAELEPEEWVQSPEHLLSIPDDELEQATVLMGEVLDYLHRQRSVS
ncbi:type 1 glutamine amidotransferase [Halopseudomonas pelagia]|uniref:type 1 glutamine amidotransferase n=1 Tax=Halopseudomonas pelagia TaxID=553151 RepID=UPI0003A8FCB6|nr:type 1 glutamine amidotransferase [Halopseudomonas pelagia]|tara:strand:- start:66 stop:770 length:705 start_codon:yes stop_codon:yes gene_type:complete